MKTKLLLVLLGLALIAGNIYFGVKYFTARADIKEARTLLAAKTTNDKIIEFTKLFVVKVLKAEAEVDFETRLKLENAVRDLKNEEILAQWQKFTESQTEIEAQTQVKNLLDMLVNKIKL